MEKAAESPSCHIKGPRSSQDEFLQKVIQSYGASEPPVDKPKQEEDLQVAP